MSAPPLRQADGSDFVKRSCMATIVFAQAMHVGGVLAQDGESAFAASVLDYAPAPGQRVRNAQFNDPARALGAPSGGGRTTADQSSQVTLGGFGGSITLGFDHTVWDDARNPLGLDAIVFSNAFWPGADPNRHWAECGYIEICRDENSNGLPDPDEPWLLIPGSHLVAPAEQYACVEWDDDFDDGARGPADPTWMPPDRSGVWETCGYVLPEKVFGGPIVTNPLADGEPQLEGIFGYADYAPTLVLGDLDGDDVVDAPLMTAEEFYTLPDDPLAVGISRGAGGGDAFDIAWAVDPDTLAPGGLDGFDFLRITTGTHKIHGALGEISTEIDAVADVSPGRFGDADADRDVDEVDFEEFLECSHGEPDDFQRFPCSVMDFDQNGRIGLKDFGAFQIAFGDSP